MARPVKFRKVCDLPENSEFGPLDSPSCHRDFVNLEVDEYEAIRLIDLEGFTQEECARQMNVSRPTVQRIYMGARKKLAQSLVDGKVLKIQGGRYLLCDNRGDACGRPCRKNRHIGGFRGE